MIKGEKVFLDTVEEKDLEQLRRWRNLPEYRKFFREYREISSGMQKKWYESKVLDDKSTIMFAIRDTATEELLGCCGLCYINWIHRYSDLSLYIGKNECYIDDEGIAQEACTLLFEYAFKELGLKKIWTELYEFDEKKLCLYKKLNMTVDGRWRSHYFYSGRYWDSLILEILQEEWLDTVNRV